MLSFVFSFPLTLSCTYTNYCSCTALCLNLLFAICPFSLININLLIGLKHALINYVEADEEFLSPSEVQ